MSKTKTQKPTNEWGIPDWRDASAYPDPNNTSLEIWEWEFLRRRKDYREDWLKYAPETYTQKEIEYQANPVTRIQLWHKQTTMEPVWQEWSNKPTPLESLEFCAEMPGLLEKFDLKWMPHPGNPRPDSTPFPSRRKSYVEYDLAGGVFIDHWGIKYSFFPSEVAFRFELTTLPVENLMASLQKPQQFSDMDRSLLDIDDESKVNLLHWLWSEYKPIWESPKNKNPNHEPRYVEEPHNHGVIHLILDRSQPLGPQLKQSKPELKRLQRKLGLMIKGYRCNPKAWKKYLRILDARETLQDNEEATTYEKIGKVILGMVDYGTAKARAKQDHDAALFLMSHFPHHSIPKLVQGILAPG